MTRLAPLQAPFDPPIEELLTSMMPPGVPPIGLFRTFAHNPTLAGAMRGWGGYELSAELSLTMREREILIDRTCALTSCEYEWGVHIAFFSERVGLSHEQVRSLTHGHSDDPCWSEASERALIVAADELHSSADVSDSAWTELTRHYDAKQQLDILFLCGWYHAISFAATACRTPPEDGAPSFADYA